MKNLTKLKNLQVCQDQDHQAQDNLQNLTKPKQIIPKHLAVVMDGNGRWATSQDLPRIEGHKKGFDALKKTVKWALEKKISVLSLYAFSTENWNRSIEEIRFLMGYSRTAIRELRDLFDSYGVKIVWSGSEKKLWESVINELKIACDKTKDNKKMILNLCINYGGQQELIDTTQKIVAQALTKKINPNKINAKTIEQNLYVPNLPPVDMFLRTSGEKRISNFMLWQSAYAELIFISELWPNINSKILEKALDEYSLRQRRFGA